MKVAELMEFLERCDPEAEVMLGIQPSWPFEHRIKGVVVRRDFVEPEYDEEGKEIEPPPVDRHRDSFATAGQPDDVFLVEGGQIRYGNKAMFDAV